MSNVYQIELNDHFHEFVTKLVASGQYQDASDVFRDGLRLLERQDQKRKEKLALLKSLADEGFRELDQGLGIEFKTRKELRDMIRGIGRDVATNVGEKQP